jgi:hypothetical protein
MTWNCVKLAVLPVLVAAMGLGGAVLARQGSGGGQEPKAALEPPAPQKAFMKTAVDKMKAVRSGPPLSRDQAERIRNLEDLLEKVAEWSRERDLEPPRALEENLSRDQALERIKQLEDMLKTTVDAKELDQVVKAEQVRKKNEHIRELLARKYDLDIAVAASLEQFLKAVKKATTDKDDPGIPIYVNPVGLEDAGHNMESGVRFERGSTLGETLQKSLKPLHLDFDVQEGMLVIDSRLGIVESGLQRVEDKLDRLIKREKAK